MDMHYARSDKGPRPVSTSSVITLESYKAAKRSAQIAPVLAAHAEGLSNAGIARKTGHNATYVAKILKSCSIPRNPSITADGRVFSSEELALAKKMRADGAGLVKVGKALKCKYTQIQKLLGEKSGARATALAAQMQTVRNLVDIGKYRQEIAKTLGWSVGNLVARSADCKIVLPIDPQLIAIAYKHLYHTMLKSALRRQVDCDLTFEEFLSFIATDASCAYCQSPVVWGKKQKDPGGKAYNLDRVDNTLGYTKSNLIICCYVCNMTRSNRFSHEEFLMVGPAIAKVIEMRLREAA